MLATITAIVLIVIMYFAGKEISIYVMSHTKIIVSILMILFGIYVGSIIVGFVYDLLKPLFTKGRTLEWKLKI